MRIDVLIPHYADSEGLARSLESLSSQTWQGQMRVVVQDDGSPEQAALAAETVCSGFVMPGRLEIDYVGNAQNQGRPATRNLLLKEVRAPYLGWLDAGDIWYPEKLEHQFAMLQQLVF